MPVSSSGSIGSTLPSLDEQANHKTSNLVYPRWLPRRHRDVAVGRSRSHPASTDPAGTLGPSRCDEDTAVEERRIRARGNQRPPRRSETSLATSFRFNGFIPLEAILAAILLRSRPSGDIVLPWLAPFFGVVVATRRFTTFIVTRGRVDIQTSPIMTHDATS